MGQEASGLGSAGILGMMVFALWGARIGGSLSGYAALVADTGVYIGNKHLFGHEQPYLLSLAAAVLAYLSLASVRSTEKPATRLQSF